MKSETIMLSVAIALAIALVGGLVVVPTMIDGQQALADKGGIPHNGNHGNHNGHINT